MEDQVFHDKKAFSQSDLKTETHMLCKGGWAKEWREWLEKTEFKNIKNTSLVLLIWEDPFLQGSRLVAEVPCQFKGLSWPRHASYNFLGLLLLWPSHLEKVHFEFQFKARIICELAEPDKILRPNGDRKRYTEYRCLGTCIIDLGRKKSGGG